MTVEIVSASRAHVGRIARRMRAVDRRECAAKGKDPACALRFSLAGSAFALTAKVDGSPHAMFGVWPRALSDGVGVPWFLGTDEVYRRPRVMLSTGRDVIELMSDSFRRLENVVSAENAQAIRMLKAWGFSVGEDSQMIGGLAFLPFWRERHV